MEAFGSQARQLAINGLDVDHHGEEQAVGVFAGSLRDAAAEFLEDPLGAPMIPNWNRVVSAIPEFFESLRSAVAHDNGVEQIQAA